MGNAGRIAGLDVIRMVREPIAAAIAYEIDQKGGDQNILVCNLGRGMFEVTVESVEDGVFEVLSTTGTVHLGGKGFQNRVLDHSVGDLVEHLTRERFEELNPDLIKEIMNIIKQAIRDANLQKHDFTEVRAPVCDIS